MAKIQRREICENEPPHGKNLKKNQPKKGYQKESPIAEQQKDVLF